VRSNWCWTVRGGNRGFPAVCVVMVTLALSCRWQPSGPSPRQAAPEAEAARPSLRAEAMLLLEDVEKTRMLLGAAMWHVHDVRNFALYGASAPSAEDFDRESLRLYEALKPLDYAASSLLGAIDLEDDRTAEADLRFIRAELGPVAAEVLAHYRAVAAQREKARAELIQRATAAGLKVERIQGKPWDDPLRERQRQPGVQLGWRTNIEPPPAFREHAWNRRQKLDIRYQLRKGQLLGVTHIVPKDPILRWDWVETAPNTFQWQALDRVMRLAIEHGMKVKLILPTMGGGVPEWWAKQRPQALIPNDKGETRYRLNGGTYAHDFMGPVDRSGPWYESIPVNLADPPTRERFGNFILALRDHCRKSGYLDHILAISPELFHAQRHWRTPPGADLRKFVVEHYRAVGAMLAKAFPGMPVDLEVTDGEAHFVDTDLSAHEWRSLGLTEALGTPAVASETPFFEDLMRAVALQSAERRAGKPVEAGPFFYQNCEYGFGTMLSVNHFTSLLRDGLWSDGWFGPEGILRWGYFPQLFTWNDRQLQWSAITNVWLGNRQAHLLSPTLANTRVAPADVLLLLPSSSLDPKDSRTNRELVGWGWALTALKVQYDVLTESALASGVPPRARLLILPQATVLGEAQAKAIRSFVQNGGLLVASRVPGTDGSAPSPLADVLGCAVKGEVTQTGVRGTWLQRTVARGAHSGRYQPVPLPDQGYPRPDYRDGRAQFRQPYQALAPAQGAKVVASYGSGEPAVVEHAFGKGKALTLGYPFGNEIVFADWTSVAFGKIYSGWPREEQMLGMLRWLGDALTSATVGLPDRARLGEPAVAHCTVPEGWRYRFGRFERAAPSLAYPKGPSVADGADWALVASYLDPRPGHRLREEHDERDYAAELTWRDRPGVAARYLAVGNRESAYAGERGAVQFWLMPHRFRIRIADPAVRWVYDVAAEAPVALERDERGVSFLTTVPPALGRVFAVSTTDAVELFDDGAEPQEKGPKGPQGPKGPKEAPQAPSPLGPFSSPISFAELEARVALIASPRKRPAPSEALHPSDIAEWLASRRGGKLAICFGDAAYRPAAERLAAWLKESFHIAAEPALDDGRFEVDREGYQVTFRPAEAEILIGNAWSNNTVASLDATFPYNNREAPAALPGRLTATYAWPGGGRGIVTLTRELDFRRADHTAFGLSYGDTSGFAPRGVNTAPRPSLRQRLLILASTPAGAMNAVAQASRLWSTGQRPVPPAQVYAKPGELDPLPSGTASLHETPWRSNVRTVPAADALAGIGVYYKHVPATWTEAEHTAVMKQLAAAGVRRLRLAPHHAIYITKDWTAPKPQELASLRNELRACKAAGIRPCVVFVHVPPVGKPGTRELQDWWRQGDLMPVGGVGSPEFNAYLDKTYQALLFILKEARDAGFKEPGSYDLEMGQNLWWGAPACPRPFPSTGLEALRPGGRFYEFDRALCQRLRKDGFAEPALWWGETHHHFEQCSDADVPPECAGRAISIYSAWTGVVPDTWLARGMYEKPAGPNDVWPPRPPLRFLDGAPPHLVLARPESWMADRTRRDNLLELIRASKTPVCITSIGTVPAEIPEFVVRPSGRSSFVVPPSGGPDGWQIKQRALTRTLAFWLNQGASFVLLHSAYEGANDEMSHALMPEIKDPAAFRWQDASPLAALRAFCDGLKDAKPMDSREPRATSHEQRKGDSPSSGSKLEARGSQLSFRFSLSPDPILIPPRTRASDLVALLPFQLDERRFAVATYVLTPNIAERLRPVRMTVEVDRRLASATTRRPSTQMEGCPLITARTGNSTTLSFDLADDVTWLELQVDPSASRP